MRMGDGSAAALWLAGTLLLAACKAGGEDNRASAAPVENDVATAAVPPVTEPPIDREALLLAVIRAASVAASGQPDSNAQRMLDGKLFELAIRFGCGQAPAERQALGWRVDADSRTLRLSARPDVAADDPLVAAIVERGGFEAVEGFWVARPWLLTDTCPVAPAPEPAETEPGKAAEAAPTPAPAPAAQRVGIVQFFSPSDPRTGRRSGRPYQSVVQLAEGEAPPANGLNLILSGRLRALPGGKVIACAAVAQDRPPDCLVSAEVDRVRMERPEGGAPLAEWRR